jgi:hypothetical protein
MSTAHFLYLFASDILHHLLLSARVNHLNLILKAPLKNDAIHPLHCLPSDAKAFLEILNLSLPKLNKNLKLIHSNMGTHQYINTLDSDYLLDYICYLASIVPFHPISHPIHALTNTARRHVQQYAHQNLLSAFKYMRNSLLAFSPLALEYDDWFNLRLIVNVIEHQGCKHCRGTFNEKVFRNDECARYDSKLESRIELYPKETCWERGVREILESKEFMTIAAGAIMLGP